VRATLSVQLVRIAVSPATTPARSKAMLDTLVTSAQRGEHPDYAAAEQATMAMVPPLLADTHSSLERRPDVERPFHALRDDSRIDPRVCRKFAVGE